MQKNICARPIRTVLTLLENQATGDDNSRIQDDYEDAEQGNEDVVEAQDARLLRGTAHGCRLQSLRPHTRSVSVNAVHQQAVLEIFGCRQQLVINHLLAGDFQERDLHVV